MAKSEVATPRSPGESSKYEDWRVDDAMRTMMRAGEIVGDKKMMALVKKKAAEHAEQMQDVAKQAAQLAKSGRISPKQMAKLGGVK